jgi:hypothetical protein
MMAPPVLGPGPTGLFLKIEKFTQRVVIEYILCYDVLYYDGGKGESLSSQIISLVNTGGGKMVVGGKTPKWNWHFVFSSLLHHP